MLKINKFLFSVLIGIFLFIGLPMINLVYAYELEETDSHNSISTYDDSEYTKESIFTNPPGGGEFTIATEDTSSHAHHFKWWS